MPRSTSRLRFSRSPTTEPDRSALSVLERWKSISAIISAIAIPFVLAIVGYFIQKQLADEGLKKDYVMIATNILKENPTNQEPDLRRWAVTMLDSNSPIPFSGKAKEGLEKGTYFAIAPARMPDPPIPCMKEPRKARVQPLVHKFSKRGAHDMDEILRQYEELLEVAVKAEEEAMEDRNSLKCMQDYGRIIKDATAEDSAIYARPTSRRP